MTNRKRVAVLGSTGSIGTQTLDVISNFPELFEVTRLAAGRNLDLLEKQRDKFGLDIDVARSASNNDEILTDFASADDVDIVVNGVVGFAGFKATIAALKSNKTLALANKESLIAGGPLVRKVTSAPGFTGEIIPVDSEHSAIWQCLKSGNKNEVDEIVLTASGGPFRTKTLEELKNVKKEDALKHPTWSMGDKITIDSSTLMNKGLEVIEAHELFDIDFDHIKVVVHPQSLVHSMVTFVDGATIAQLSHPDMRLPISLSLGAPIRLEKSYGKMSFTEKMLLNFEPPRLDAFPCLALAYEAGRASGDAPAILSAVNEVAVEAFLDGQIGWSDIYSIVSEVLQFGTGTVDTEEELFESDSLARIRARKILEGRASK
jgi:1-deoxy-D-xylulose-5-phosphate reductoisomerase